MTGDNLYSEYEMNGRYYIKTPAFLFGKSDNCKSEAKLFGLELVDYLKLVRDDYGGKLVSYGSFVGYNFDNIDSSRKLKNELNRRLRIVMRK